MSVRPDELQPPVAAALAQNVAKRQMSFFLSRPIFWRGLNVVGVEMAPVFTREGILGVQSDWAPAALILCSTEGSRLTGWHRVAARKVDKTLWRVAVSRTQAEPVGLMRRIIREALAFRAIHTLGAAELDSDVAQAFEGTCFAQLKELTSQKQEKLVLEQWQSIQKQFFEEVLAAKGSAPGSVTSVEGVSFATWVQWSEQTCRKMQQSYDWPSIVRNMAELTQHLTQMTLIAQANVDKFSSAYVQWDELMETEQVNLNVSGQEPESLALYLETGE